MMHARPCGNFLFSGLVIQDEHGAYDGALSQYQLALESLLPILSGERTKSQFLGCPTVVASRKDTIFEKYSIPQSL